MNVAYVNKLFFEPQSSFEALELNRSIHLYMGAHCCHTTLDAFADEATTSKKYILSRKSCFGMRCHSEGFRKIAIGKFSSVRFS